MSETVVRKATAADAGAVSALLARAFDDDPGMRWLARDDARTPGALELYFQVVFARLTLPHGEVWIDEDRRGAALWVPPGKWKLGLLQQIPLAPAMVRVFGWSRLRRSLASIDLVTRHHPAEPHYYLQTLGVDPAHQRKGVGDSLMRPILARCDELGIGAYLEAIDKNVPMYRARGFQVTATAPLAGGGPLMHFMWRAPRPGSAHVDPQRGARRG